MSNFTWETTFRELYDRCCEKYRAGDRDRSGWYSEADLAFLKSIGYSQVEFFDFVEDFCVGGDPSPETAVLIAAVRRDYLRVVQEGKTSDKVVPASSLPPKDGKLAGYRWLPRIIAKARAKLRGELDPDTMFFCGGDRAFLRKHDIHAADFLRVVWDAGDDDEKIIEYVKGR